MSTTNTTENLRDYATEIIKKAKDQFDVIEVCAIASREQHIKILDQHVAENVTSNSCSLGIRMIKDTKQMIASTSDLSFKTFDRLIENAHQNISHLPEDANNIVNPDFIETLENDLKITDDRAWPSIDAQIKTAQELEKLALENTQISKSNGATMSLGETHFLLVNSLGFNQSYNKNYASKVLALVAGHDQHMQQHYEFSSKTHMGDLTSNQVLATKGAEETIRKLNPGTIASGDYPVLFDPKMAAQFFAHFLGAINGLSIIRKTSFLQGMLGQEIFNPTVSISDNATLKKGLASKPFDGDGMATKPFNLVEKGVLKTWLLDYKSAQQLGMQSTRTATRGPSSAPSPSSTNITIDNGTESVNNLISHVKKGVFITGMMGMGINSATGDLSQGANGFLIENGQITTPISGFTIAGNLKDIFKNMQLANDLQFERRINSPSFFIPSMTIAST